MAILVKDLPMGLYHLLTYWEGEEMDPEIREKYCDGKISEEEEVKMFLEWCQEEHLSLKERKNLQELLAKMK